MIPESNRLRQSRRPAPKADWPGRLAWTLLAMAALLLVVHLASAQTNPESLSRAIEAQRSVVAGSPSDPAGYKDLGNLLALRGDQDAAEDAYRRALELDPSDAGALYDLALLLSRERPAEARKLLLRSLELDPESAWAHYTLGTLRQRDGRRKEAIRSFARAFVLDPKLALPDVNPQVIGNPDLTAALLRAEHAPPIATAPRDYADPARITSLLTEGPPTEGTAPTGDPAAPATQPPTAAPPTTSGDATPLSEPPAQAVADPAPAAGTPASAEAAPAAGAVPAPRRLSTEDLRDQEPARGGVGVPGAGSSSPSEPPGASDATPPPARFRPGRRSSARLELQLQPIPHGELRIAADTSSNQIPTQERAAHDPLGPDQGSSSSPVTKRVGAP